MSGHPRCGYKPAIRRLGTLASALILNLVAVTAAVATDAWHAVRGSELRSVFVDHELADGVHYAYQFHADGTFIGFNMGKAISGNWRTVPDTFCWTWVRPAVAEECFTVERNSANFRFVRDGTEIFTGTLAPAKVQAPSRGVTQ